MKRMCFVRCLSGAALMLSCFLCTPRVFADSDSFTIDDNDFNTGHSDQSTDAMDNIDHDRQPWELTIAPAYAVLLGPKFEHTDYSNGGAAEGSLFYQVHPWWQLGLEGGYSFGHVDNDTFFTFDGIDYLVEQRLEVARVTPEIRFGSWMPGPNSMRWRPYLQAGAGWYELIQKTNFKISANQFLFRFLLDERTNDYLGVNGGAGVEFEVYPQGVIGLSLAYHQVFSTPDNLQFFSPSLRFSYLF